MSRPTCDTCGKRADTIHLIIPWVTDAECVEFGCSDKACPQHDPGGYWFDIDRWITGGPDFNDHGRPYTMRLHLLDTKGIWPVKLVDAFLAGGHQAVLELRALREEIEHDVRRLVEREQRPAGELRIISAAELVSRRAPSTQPPWAA